MIKTNETDIRVSVFIFQNTTLPNASTLPFDTLGVHEGLLVFSYASADALNTFKITKLEQADNATFTVNLNDVPLEKISNVQVLNIDIPIVSNVSKTTLGVFGTQRYVRAKIDINMPGAGFKFFDGTAVGSLLSSPR